MKIKLRLRGKGLGYGFLLGAVSLAFFSCSFMTDLTHEFSFSFSKPMTPTQFALQQQIENFYYEEVDSAFFSGNVEVFCDLYSPGIVKPMDSNQIHAWAQKFFKEHPSAHFVVKNLFIDEMSYVRAVVRVKYQVVTAGGEGSFSGYERDVLTHQKNAWFISSWEKLNPETNLSGSSSSSYAMPLPFDSAETPAARGQ